jgi:predicted double-glycine peptidase
MIEPATIEAEIVRLTAEEALIRNSHAQLIREHQARTVQVQDIALNNANRIQQIKGAISQLQQLLNGHNGHAEQPQPERTTP